MPNESIHAGPVDPNRLLHQGFIMRIGTWNLDAHWGNAYEAFGLVTLPLSEAGGEESA